MTPCFIAYWIKPKHPCLTYEALHHRVLLACLTHLPITQPWELPWSSVSLVTPLPMHPSTAESETKFLPYLGSHQCSLNWITAPTFIFSGSCVCGGWTHKQQPSLPGIIGPFGWIDGLLLLFFPHENVKECILSLYYLYRILILCGLLDIFGKYFSLI